MLTNSSRAVVKLGGSLITTHLEELPIVDRACIGACAAELSARGLPLVLVHGTGTFGKPPAVRHGYLDGRLSAKRSDVVARVACELSRLELEVTQCLEVAGLRPLRLPALSLYTSSGDGICPIAVGLISDLLSRGVTPVIGGGFVAVPDGFAVCSSDRIAVDLAVALQAESLVLATRASGVYRDYGRSEAIFDVMTPEDCTQLEVACDDVSGGMRAKVTIGFRAAREGISTYIVDGRKTGNLSGALMGRPTSGTRLFADAAPC